MKFIFSLIVLGVGFIAQSQVTDVTGKVLDNATNQPVVFRPADQHKSILAKSGSVIPL